MNPSPPSRPDAAHTPKWLVILNRVIESLGHERDASAKIGPAHAITGNSQLAWDAEYRRRAMQRGIDDINSAVDLMLPALEQPSSPAHPYDPVACPGTGLPLGVPNGRCISPGQENMTWFCAHCEGVAAQLGTKAAITVFPRHTKGQRVEVDPKLVDTKP